VLEPGAIFRRLFGGGIDPALRPVLGVALAGSVAGSLLWSFTGIWAIKELGARSGSSGSPSSSGLSQRPAAATSADTSPTTSGAGRSSSSAGASRPWSRSPSSPSAISCSPGWG